MQNDLTKFEKDLLKNINMLNGTKYTYENFMEWSNSEKHIDKNLQQGEKKYRSMGMFVAIRP